MKCILDIFCNKCSLKMDPLALFVKYTRVCQWHVYFTVYEKPVVNLLQSSSSLTLIVFEYLRTDEFTVAFVA